MKPLAVREELLCSVVVRYHLGFDISKTQEALIFRNMDENFGMIEYLDYRKNFKSLNHRGKFLVGRLCSIDFIKQIKIELDTFEVLFQDDCEEDRRIIAVNMAIKLVAPDKLHQRGRIFNTTTNNLDE
jgi:hypothetical protein